LAGNQLCNRTEGACVDCTKDSDCDELQYCDAGACKRDVCAEGVKTCVGNAIVECKANGSGILAPSPCGPNEKCVKSGTTVSCEVPKLPDGGTPPPATCSDGVKNGDETAVDCGGALCKKCSDGAGCAVGGDCKSNVCEASCTGLLCFPGTRTLVCRPAQCSDNVKNGDETDVDCGGSACSRCAVGQACAKAGDCEANVCTAGQCVPAQCTAEQCPACIPTEAACCKTNGLCGCALVFPLQGSCG
jgi:hypothetical protein